MANPSNVKVELYSVVTPVKDDQGHKLEFTEPGTSASQMATAAPHENSRTSEASSITQEGKMFLEAETRGRRPHASKPWSLPKDSVDEDRIFGKGRVHRDQEEKFAPCAGAKSLTTANSRLSRTAHFPRKRTQSRARAVTQSLFVLAWLKLKDQHDV